MSKATPLTVIFAIALFASCADAHDQHETAIAEATDLYEAAREKYDTKVKTWFDEQEKRARQRGDRAAIVMLKSQWEAYTSSRIPPANLPPRITRAFDSAQKRLRKDYATIVSDLTRDGLDERATAAEQKLEAILNGPRFVQLFNGRNLDGWEQLPTDSSTWQVEKGVLLGKGNGGFLFNKRPDFKNFVLRAEVRLTSAENGGLFLRCPMKPGRQQGYEINLNSPTRPNETKQTGTIRSYLAKGSAFPPKVVDVAPHGANDWFEVRVVADGDKISVIVNGNPVSEVVDQTYATGRLALQHHVKGQMIAFRKIELLELSDD